MSKKRYINDNIWEDNYIIELSTQEKLLFIYLLTNNRLSICWIYEISIRKIEMETALSSKTISDTFKKFEKDWKMYFRDWIILITNFLKNQSLNDNMKKWIERELEELWWEKLSIFTKTKGFERLWKALESFDIPYLTLLNLTLLNLTSLENSSKEEWEQALEVIPPKKEIEEFGDRNINELLETIKGQVEFLWLIYKKWRYERERAKNILTGKEFWEICEKTNMSRIEFCKSIIYTSSLLTFWNGKINNAETLYKHYAQVYNDAVNKKTEMENRPRRWLEV